MKNADTPKASKAKGMRAKPRISVMKIAQIARIAVHPHMISTVLRWLKPSFKSWW